MSQMDLSVSCVYELQVVRKEPYLFDRQIRMGVRVEIEDATEGVID